MARAATLRVSDRLRHQRNAARRPAGDRCLERRRGADVNAEARAARVDAPRRALTSASSGAH
jgi:hypothetical protein